MIVRPDTSAETLWLRRPTRLLHDPVTGNLLALERDEQRIVEFTTAGRFLGGFGGRGEGPGKLANLSAFGVAGDHVIALDIGNGKLVVFDRATRRMTTEIRLNRVVRDITTIGDTLLVLMPGPDGSLFELLRPEGGSLSSFGDGGFVAGRCSQCSITYIGGERLAVVKPAFPEGRIYRIDGTMVDAFAFMELNDVLTRWREDFLEMIRRTAGMVADGSGGRVAAGKLWVGKPVALSRGGFLVGVLPEEMDRNPTELWELDHRGRITKRYVFGRTWIGNPTASLSRIYTIGLDGRFEIDEHLLPGVADSH